MSVGILRCHKPLRADACVPTAKCVLRGCIDRVHLEGALSGCIERVH